LEGKVCIVTGAASGIGRASAELFAEEGATVVAADLEGTAYRVDVGDEEETRALADTVVAEHGRIDVLLNNAGVAGVGDVGETTVVEGYLRESYADPEEGRRSIRSRQLSGELGLPEDVARAALYLASDESRFVMGAGLVVDGGLSAGKL